MLNFEQQLESLSQRLQTAVGRLHQISREAVKPELTQEALAFNLERAAWAMTEQAQAWVFELRLGIPRKETECFDLLQRHGWLELESARRYKQLSEFRSLSSREALRIDWQYLRGDLSAELALFLEWDALVQTWEETPS